MSSGLQEYRIKRDHSFWYITRYKQGILAPELKGRWTTHSECEAVLIRYLRKKDKFGKAIYPGAQSNYE